MIKTYRENDILTLPGTIAGLLDGYCGPIQRTDGAWWGEVWCATHEDPDWVRRLPLSRPEAMYRVVCWLSEGERCFCCRLDGAQPDNPRSGLVDPHCPDCSGTGYIRTPFPLWWTLSGLSTLPGWVCRGVIHASVLRVAAGMKPVVGVARWIAQHCGWCVQGGPILTVDYLSLLDGYALLDGDQLRIDIPAAPGGENDAR